MTALLAKIRTRLNRSDFVKNVAILTGGTMLGRVILVLATPALTRFYTPHDFELLAVYMSLLALFTVVAGARLDLAVPLPEHDADAMNVLSLALGFTLIVSIVLALFVMIAPEQALSWIGQPDFAGILWMVPAGVFCGAAYQALQYWASRKKRYTLVTHTRVTRALGGTGVQIGGGLAGAETVGLLSGQLVYNAVGTLPLLRDIWRNDRAVLSNISWKSMWENLKAQWRFPVFSVPEALMNTAGTQLPVLIIAAQSNTAEAGYLMLAMQVMMMPLALIGRSVGQVYLAEAADRYRAGTLGAFTRRTAKTLFLWSGVPILALGLVAPFLFPVVFGSAWERAGEIVLWMTPWVILQFVSSPLSTVFHATNRQQMAMILQVVGFAVRVLPLIAIAAAGTYNLTEAYAVLSAIFYGLYVLLILRVAR